ncbi:ankyrin repeat protein [Fadolivirus algeromassiliense]|jgi:hypothetical protein|uniref:Ankyrin repeat protein n=1 Tax=Fadolivirus FV1/VV64 TaxID=3070911 RepID=A0A7D3V627_9VIRU|nr:ankyrin repeat protein [Fadolivirus algeromassiliense]QKF94792.1 ankyrin repeat protein [Fadolivirus FV1/VV64]
MLLKCSSKFNVHNVKRFATFVHCSKSKINNAKKFTTVDEYLKYTGFKHVNDTYLETIPAGYDYGDTDFHYYIFPLYEAINNSYPDLDLVELLLRAGADPNFQSKTCSASVLHTVLINDNWWNDNTIALLELLIRYGANVNQINKNDGSTPLHEVAFAWPNRYAEEIMELLIDNGAQINKWDFKLKTPRDNVLSSHEWNHRKNLPLPEKILNLLDPLPKNKCNRE